jgi:hypothetical protein
MRWLPAIPSAAPIVSSASVTISAGLRFCLVHDKTAALVLGAVQATDRGLRFNAGTHFYEAEAARLAGKFIRNDSG